MKSLKCLFTALFFTLAFVACSDDDTKTKDDGDNPSATVLTTTWSLQKTETIGGQDVEDCATAYQIKFNDDRNDENLGSYISYTDSDCDGTFDGNYEGTYLYGQEDASLTINYSTGFHDYFIENLTADELVIYDALGEYLYFTKVVDDDNNNDDDDSDPDQDELKADFNPLPLCCPPVTISGRYFDEVQVDFENQSTGDIVAYEWSFGSTEKNPTETFSLSNSFNQNELEFELTVTDSDGNTDSMTKSIELPILMASGTITFGGQTCEVNYYDAPSNSPQFPPYYLSTTGDNGDWVAFAIKSIEFSSGCDIPSPAIRIGGYLPGQRVSMTQVEDYTPTQTDNFSVSFGSYYTFDDPGGAVSSGSVNIAGIENGAHIITNIGLSGRVENYQGDQKDFEIDLHYIPHVCYYGYTIICDAQPAQ